MDDTAAKKLLLVGWDSADWSIIRPLLDEGKMPNLAGLIESGVMGDLSTLYPSLSPMIWTSIATGKRPYKHGIYGFSEPSPHGGVQPVTNLSRKTRTIWNMMHLEGLTSNVVGWWPSHPAEPIRGVMVSNHYQQVVGPLDKAWTVKPGTVHPQRLVEPLAGLRLHPAELTAEHIGPFVPDFGKIDQDKDKRLENIAKTLAECTSVHAAATALMQLEPWDFMAVYYDSIDHFCHGFMRYHPPRMPMVSEEDFEMYKDVVTSGYRYHDLMLGALLHLAGPETTVMLISDHGFHAGGLRPKATPLEPAGPAVQHRDYGIFVMKGPGIKKDERIYGASVLDIAPTILYAMGKPVGEDMDGVPLISAFVEPEDVRSISTWDEVPGEDGTHPPEMVMDPVDSDESMRQLVALGYIDKPDDNMEKAIEETRRELDYNLARSYMSGMRYMEAAPLLEKIYERWPFEHRFAIQLICCHQNLGQIEQARHVLDRLKEHIQTDVMQSRKELEEWQKTHTKEDGEKLSDQERHRLSQLASRSRIDQSEVIRLDGVQLLVEKQYVAALACFEKVQELRPERPQPLLHIGETHMRLRHWVKAEESFEKALELDPDFVLAHLGLCRCYLHQNRDMEASSEALRAVGLNYQMPTAHFYLGVALTRMNRLQRAVEALKTAILINPNFPPAYRYLSVVYGRRLNDPVQAAEYRQAADEARQRLADMRSGAMNAQHVEKIRSRRHATSDSDTLLDHSDVPSAISLPLEETLVVVSGLPRSGTSMMMQMLRAGGLPICADEKRSADNFNEKGYYEDVRVRALRKNNQWLKEMHGRAVKVVAPLLFALPADPEQRTGVIFMERHISDVVHSQERMIAGLERHGADIPEERLMDHLEKQVLQAKRLLAMRHIPTLTIQYEECLRHPAETARRVNDFLGGTLDAAAMEQAVDATLCHMHSSEDNT
ncbi:MAG: tetratricopeptide repeat protein [Spartobacteria bacterium]|nr:tetratricopeptide repeat protein [Spartobacteria bacterium]